MIHFRGPYDFCCEVNVWLPVNYAAVPMTSRERAAENRQPIGSDEENMEDPIEDEIGIRII